MRHLTCESNSGGDGWNWLGFVNRFQVEIWELERLVDRDDYESIPLWESLAFGLREQLHSVTWTIFTREKYFGMENKNMNTSCWRGGCSCCSRVGRIECRLSYVPNGISIPCIVLAFCLNRLEKTGSTVTWTERHAGYWRGRWFQYVRCS